MSQSILEPEGTAHLTQAQVAQFVNDGFVIVPGLGRFGPRAYGTKRIKK